MLTLIKQIHKAGRAGLVTADVASTGVVEREGVKPTSKTL